MPRMKWFMGGMVFSVQFSGLSVRNHIPHWVHPSGSRLVHYIATETSVVQRPLTTGMNPVGKKSLNVAKLSESFGYGFSVFFIHKCVGITGRHESAMQMRDAFDFQFTHDHAGIAALFF